MDGILLVNKPIGPTTYDLIRQMKRIVKRKMKIGHTGTLDPMAEGLVMICLGKTTRISRYLLGKDKQYRGEITFGVSTDSYDATGEIVKTNDSIKPTLNDIKNVLKNFIGEINQAPPIYSAKKQNGMKLYKMAHLGITPDEIRSHKVKVYDFEILDYEYPKLKFTARVGSGTYIRSLANDIGEMLACGGHLSALKRTSIGDFDLKDAVNLSDIEDSLNPLDSLINNLISVGEALKDFPAIELSDIDIIKKILVGTKININEINLSINVGEKILLINRHDQRAICFCDVIEKEGEILIKPKIYFQN